MSLLFNKFIPGLLLTSFAVTPLFGIDNPPPFLNSEQKGEYNIADRDRDRGVRQKDTRLQRRYFENRGYYYYDSPYVNPYYGTQNYYYYYSRPRDYYYDIQDNGSIYYYQNQ